MSNPWRDSTKSFVGVEDILQMASAVAVFDKLNLDTSFLPVEPLKLRVEESLFQMNEISKLEELLEKIVFDIQEFQFSIEYRDLLHSAEIEKKATLLNEICEKIGNVVKNKRILIEMLQQKGVCSDSLPLHRNYHRAFSEFFKLSESLINKLPQNLAIIEQASTTDPVEFRKHARLLVDHAGRLQKFFSELDDIAQ